MTLFLSTVVNKIDKKGRVSIPAPFRSILGEESFILYRSIKWPILEGCHLNRLQKLSESIDQLDIFSEAQDDLTASIFADAIQLNCDSNGRAQIPQEFLEYAQIKDQIAFVGRGASFQLWEPKAFCDHQERARQRLREKGASIRLTSGKEDGV